MALGSQYVVEREIPGGNIRLLPSQHKMHVHAMDASVRSHHSTEVGLVRAHGDKRVASGPERVRNQIIQFPGFVSSKAKSGQIVSFTEGVTGLRAWG